MTRGPRRPPGAPAPRRDHLALTQLPAAVVVTDAEGRITAWNDEASRLTGYGADERVGFTTSFEPSVAAVVQAPAFQRALAADSRWTGELEICRPRTAHVCHCRSRLRASARKTRVVGYVAVASALQ